MNPHPAAVKIDKKQINALTVFAIHNIPGTDAFTLNKFLELINTTGSFGSITLEQLKEAMRLTLKYVPHTCAPSLLIVVELLRVHLPAQLASPTTFVLGRNEVNDD
jgi:hypothetical protein